MNKLLAYWELAGALTPTTIARLSLWLQLVSIPARKKMRGRKPVPLSLFVHQKPYRFKVRDGADIATLHEVFVNKEYATAEPKWSTHTILDLGAHIGSATLYLATKYPHATVISYEADSENFALLKENMLTLPNVRCMHAAISDVDGTVPFYRSASSISSSLIQRPGSVEIRVPASSLRAALADRPDLIKFDIEGGEYRAFSSALPEIQEVALLIGEVHYDLIGKTKQEFLSLFPTYACSERVLSGTRSILTLSKDS